MAFGMATTPVLTFYKSRMSPSAACDVDGDADYSCSTSWEFCSAPCSTRFCSNRMCSNEMSCSNRVSCSIPEETEIMNFRSPLSCSTPMTSRNLTLRHLGSPEWLRGSVSGNSMGSSSSESRRSQDSGFLDSIEVRRRERGENVSAHRSISSARASKCNSQTGDFEGSRTNSAHALETIFGEAIITSSENPSSLTQTPPSASVSNKSVSALYRVSSPLLNIDNFESLNKNARNERDRNNNKGQGQTKTPVTSRPPSGSRIPLGVINRPSRNSRSSLHMSEPTRLEDRFTQEQLSGDLHRSDEVRTRRSGSSHSSFKNVSEISDTTANWQTSLLPKGFKKVSTAENDRSDRSIRGNDKVDRSISNSSSMIVKSHFDNDAMRRWLYDLRFEAEPDCLHSLQVKSVCRGGNFQIQKSSGNFKNPSSKRSISEILNSMRRTDSTSAIISEEIASIWKLLEIGAALEDIRTSALNLAQLVEDFLKNGAKNSMDRKMAELDSCLSEATSQLRMSLPSFSTYGTSERRFSHVLDHLQLNFDSPTTSRDDLRDGSPWLGPSQRSMETTTTTMTERLMHLGKVCGLLVNQRLRHDLDSILDFIGRGGPMGRAAVQVLSTVLYDGGTRLCRLAAGLRTVRALLSAMIESKDELERIYCLRCLATVLCIGEAVNDFDKAGGFEIIADTLQDDQGGLQFKIEAVAVLTQATDPWIDLDTTLTSLGIHLDKIIFSLTRLVPQCQWDEDSFLLTLAAISNLTFLELNSMEYLRAFRAVSFITKVLHHKSDFSVFVLDHISTILANMSGIESCREEIIRNHGVEFLIQFLYSSPIGLNSQAEVTATERLQQKSTIAISRLANEDGVAYTVLQMGGFHRLVQLSRVDRERNYSDGVLIAALATLRKLVSICGKEVIHDLEAEELIQPRLLDSFLLFSSRQESYV